MPWMCFDVNLMMRTDRVARVSSNPSDFSATPSRLGLALMLPGGFESSLCPPNPGATLLPTPLQCCRRAVRQGWRVLCAANAQVVLITNAILAFIEE